MSIDLEDLFYKGLDLCLDISINFCGFAAIFATSQSDVGFYAGLAVVLISLKLKFK